jgi:hypothetical protein
VPYADLETRRMYARKWIAARRKEWFEDKSCVDCGKVDDLQLDHVNPREKISHRIWSWSRDRRESELAKCVARCSECHFVKTTTNGEHVRGSENGRSVVTPDIVRDIRIRSASGESGRSIARQYKIGEHTARSIISGNTWSHI